MGSPDIRAALGLLAISGWLVLLMCGIALGGAVHLVLLGGLLAFPWRWLAAGEAEAPRADR